MISSHYSICAINWYVVAVLAKDFHPRLFFFPLIFISICLFLFLSPHAHFPIYHYPYVPCILLIGKASNYTSELAIGILALICISIAIVACACCHRNKSGFKVSIHLNTKPNTTHFRNQLNFEKQTKKLLASVHEFAVLPFVNLKHIHIHYIACQSATKTCIMLNFV